MCPTFKIKNTTRYQNPKQNKRHSRTQTPKRNNTQQSNRISKSEIQTKTTISQNS